jgi:hypothetical protein
MSFDCPNCKTPLVWVDNVQGCKKCNYRNRQIVGLIRPQHFACENCEKVLIELDTKVKCHFCGKINHLSAYEYNFIGLIPKSLAAAKKETGYYKNMLTTENITTDKASFSEQVGVMVGHCLDLIEKTNLKDRIEVLDFIDEFLTTVSIDGRKEVGDREHYKDAILLVINELKLYQ